MTDNAAVPKKNGLRGFWALVGAQFQAAFNDNAYENLLMTLAAYGVVGTAGAAGSDTNVSYVLIVFTLPFMLASPYGGQLADRFSKRTVTIGVKLGEIGIMLCGLFALFTHQLWVSLLVLGFMGIRAGIFGPSKYGIIPELVPEKKLSWANGIIELTTFIAIMGGTIAGIWLYDILVPRLHFAMVPLIALSIVGAWIALGISRVPAAAPDRRIRLNAFGQLWKYGKYAHADRVLWLAVLGNTFFWFAGAMAYQNVVVYNKNILLLGPDQLMYLRLGLMLGIGLGSYLAGVMSGGKIEYGLVPLGAIMMALPAAYLYLPGVSLWGAVVALTILGLGGGFFIVPVQALVQHRPEPQHKGGVQGVAYFLTNASSLLAGIIYLCFTLMKFNAAQIFLLMALMTLAVTGYLVWLLPDSLVRLGLWVLGHTFYRIRVLGRDNIPARGGALFVCNHMSFADAVFVTASTDRHVRFIMHSDYYNHWFIRPFARMMRAIPIAAEKGPRVVLQALRAASQAVREGDVVCIFPEGQITRTGQLLPFRRGFERIMKGIDAPIVPVHLDRVWGSIFSFQRGKFLWKWPQRIPYPITVSYGPHMPAQSRVADLRRAVQELGTEAFATRRNTMERLQREFVRQSRLHPGRFAMADGQNERVSYRQVLVRSIALARLLRMAWRDQEMVGILLPPSVGGACVNIAALFNGKVPVNLNYTASSSALESAVRQCGITNIVTSRAFIEKVRITLPCPPVYLEDIASGITTGERLGAVLAASLMPAALLERWLRGASASKSLDDTATVIFSSGSTGDPKGVMLSHYNVLSNVEGIAQVMSVEPRDRILGVLPFFHSFGFTGTLWFPLLRGFGVVYHPNPMDARIIGGLVAKYGVTLMVATPTFLQNYIRRVEPGQFGSLRYVLVGAEKLSERVAAAFEDQFGIRPMEAYGTTECSPAVTINVPGFRAAGFYQVGGKRARIGHPLPGVSARIVDPETFEPLPPGQQGMLLVKGPNLMQGYLGLPEKTSEVMHEGWYVTGDIAAMDEDGFLMVTDRLSRFSKIGGEMIPHVRIEETLHELAGVTQQTFAVTSVPDDRKGERLVVLHTLTDEAVKPVLDRLSSSGLPNLWVPRPDSFYRVDTLPVLGTGKMDLRAIRQKALELTGGGAV
jgi:acyl-[acyl-carrier-protein]-phospholipid O-acyltransferase / long-chain-fatty-acid--[acyl-carrier-protein] ligase